MTCPASSDLVAASFGRAARTYVDHAQVQSQMAAWLAEWLPEDRKGRALEVGAGPGLFTEHVLPWKGGLTASDLSKAMCEAGRERVPGAEWRVMAAERPVGGPWQWIFSSSMLQWASDPEAVFSAWKEHLSPRGRVLAGLFAEGSLQEWAGLARSAGPLAWRSPDAWRQHLADAGLKLVRDSTEERTLRYPSALAFLRSLHGAGAAPARRFPAARLRRLLHAYEERYGGRQGVKATWVFYRFEAAR